MSANSLLSHEILHLRFRTWLAMFAGLALGGVIFGIFFVRRQVVEYLPPHVFGVRAPEFFGSAHALADPLPIEGNKIELLQNGDEIFPAILKAIHDARKSVNFEAYIFTSDGTGRRFRDALIEKAREGVHVRVMLDGIGSSTKLDNSDVDRLRQAGCQFAYFHPAFSLRVDRVNRRSHRRIVVIDGKIAFTGGMGFADQWSGHAESPKHWRDSAVRIEGPLVAKLQGAFQQHWLKQTKLILTGEDEFPALPPAGHLKAQMTASHAFSAASVPMTQAVAIAAAEKRIWITNAYCTPTEDQVRLLAAAVQRGVDVRLLVPGKNDDQPATKAAGRTSYGKLLRGGVKIFEYRPTMIHQKTMVVDSLFAIFGTSNLDARSSQINEEVDITIYDDGFGRRMDDVFENDLKQARPYTLQEFESRGLWERCSEWVMRPFRSQL
jgi:cardiolipin synthase